MMVSGRAVFKYVGISVAMQELIMFSDEKRDVEKQLYLIFSMEFAFLI